MDVLVPDYSFWGYVALVLLALPFALSGVNHIRKHADLAGYAASVGFPVPALAGAPAGVALLAGAVGLFFTNVVAAYAAIGLIAFLVVATAYFHRDYKADVNFGKNLALIGALAYVLTTIVV